MTLELKSLQQRLQMMQQQKNRLYEGYHQISGQISELEKVIKDLGASMELSTEEKHQPEKSEEEYMTEQKENDSEAGE